MIKPCNALCRGRRRPRHKGLSNSTISPRIFHTGGSLLTDFPGGVARVISLPTHVKISFGLAAAASAVPTFLAFDDDPEAKWFRIVGINLTAVAAMTETGEMHPERRRRAA